MNKIILEISILNNYINIKYINLLLYNDILIFKDKFDYNAYIYTIRHIEKIIELDNLTLENQKLIGSQLFNQIFGIIPIKFRNEIFTKSTKVVINTDSILNKLPIELLYFNNNFISISYNVQRAYQIDYNSHLTDLNNKFINCNSVLILTNLPSNINSISYYSEAIKLLKVFEGYNIKTHFIILKYITKYDLIDLISQYSLIHISCHSTIINNEVMLRLNGNEYLKINDIKLINSPPKVMFLNFCQSFVFNNNLSFQNELIRKGALCVIGTLFDIIDNENQSSLILNLYCHILTHPNISISEGIKYINRMYKNKNKPILNISILGDSDIIINI